MTESPRRARAVVLTLADDADTTPHATIYITGRHRERVATLLRRTLPDNDPATVADGGLTFLVEVGPREPCRWPVS